MTQLSFFYDYSSPFAYLGATQVRRVAASKGAHLEWRPFLLGGLFKSIGTPNVPLHAMNEAKQRYQLLDMKRWAAHWGVPFSFPTRFPMNTVGALRMTLQLPNEQRADLALPLFRALWVEDRDIHDPEVLRQVADGAGFDGTALVEGTQNPEVKQRLRAETEAAEKLGLCGVPSFLVQAEGETDGVLFWGQDRLLFVEKALDGWRPEGAS